MGPRVAVVGAAGFVGSAVVAALAGHGEQRVVAVTRANHAEVRGQGRFDVLVNAACPSRRLWAEHNPGEDRAETVDKTAALLREWDFGRFVQISSISARSQLDTAYGRHRAEAEQLCDQDCLIVRLGPMYGQDYRKGALLDLLDDKPVYASGASRQSFAPVEWCAGWLAANLDRTGLWEVGARTAITLREVRDAIGSRSTFAKEYVDDQFPLTPVEADWPVAADVIAWLRLRRLASAG
jgi:nucleoside-diphosphate-sugar epimerase